MRQYETGRLYETRYGATLEGVISGLEHINDTSGLPLTLVTNCDDVLTNYNQSERYRKWKVNGWLSAKGSLVAHHEKWRRLTELVERKVSRMDARAEDASETEIMRGLGAEPFNPYAKLTATSSNY